MQSCWGECPGWVAREGITGLVSHARDVHHPETIAKGFFFRFLNLVLGISFREQISKELEEGLVVDDLLVFRVMPLVAQRSSHSVAWWNASVMLCLVERGLSVMGLPCSM